jgi:hypothetical protein
MNGWATLFTLTTAVAFTGWAALAFLPRRPVVHSFILYSGVGLLCVAYAAMFVAQFGDYWRTDPAGIDGIRAIFATDGGIVLGWTHYLAFDLFVGLWISRDADAKGFSRVAQLPILLATLMAGPIGLLIWLVVREKRARRGRNDGAAG